MSQTNKAGTRQPGAAASAAPNNTAGGRAGGTSETTPDPRSALSNALVRTFGDQFGAETPQGQPASGAGQAPPDPASQGTSDNPPGQTPADQAGSVQDPNQAVDQTPADEQTPTGDDTPPGDETPPTETGAEPGAGEPGEGSPPGEQTPADETDELPVGVQKRLGKLLGRIETLEAELAKARGGATQAAPPNAQPAGQGPLDAVMNPAELDQRESVTQGGLEEVEDLISRLSVSPQHVQTTLQRAGVQMEEWSNDSMYSWLADKRALFKTVLRAIPKRRAYLAQFQQEHVNALKLFPWMAKPDDERHALMSSFLAQAPGLRSAPNHEYWLGCAIAGHLAVEAQKAAAAKRGNGGRNTNGAGAAAGAGNGTGTRTAAAAARPGPGSGAAPTAGPRVQARTAQVNAAREKGKADPRGGLSAFLTATNFIK